KLGDVLDSEEGGVPFERLFVESLLAPQDAEQRAEALAEEIRRRAEAARNGTELLKSTEQLDAQAAQAVAGHHLPYWTERMTVAYLRTQEQAGASADADD